MNGFNKYRLIFSISLTALIFMLTVFSSAESNVDEFNLPDGKILNVYQCTSDLENSVEYAEKNGADGLFINTYDRSDNIHGIKELAEKASLKNLFVLIGVDYDGADKIIPSLSDYSDDILFVVKSADPKKISELGKKYSVKTLASYKGNIVTSAFSYMSGSVKYSLPGIYLASSVPYSIVFSKKVTEKADGKIRVIANLSDPSLCGKIRQDTETWYDDIVKRGFNVIITSDPSALKNYIDECGKERDKLEDYYKKYVVSYTLPDIDTKVYSKYKKAYLSAKAEAERCISDLNVSKSEILNAQYSLKNSVDSIEKNIESIKDGSDGVTVTPFRIAVAVLSLSAFVSFEIFVRKRTEDY